MAFIESPTFPSKIALRSTGGPEYSTEVVATSSGWEQRNANWSQARRSYQIGLVARPRSEWLIIERFFHICDGKANAFRFPDPLDHTDDGQGVVGIKANVFQMQKLYPSGAFQKRRDIQKPRGVIVFAYDGTTFTPTVDMTTGIVTMPVRSTSTATVSAITKANQASVTAAAHGLTTGEIVKLTGVVGMTQINNLQSRVTVSSASVFSLDDINSTTFDDYVSGGAINVIVEAGKAVTWTGEFDTAVRFDTDKLDGQVLDKQATGELYVSLDSIPLIEVRL